MGVYGGVALALLIITVIAIAMLEMGGSRRGPRDDVSSLQQHPRAGD